MWLGKSDLTDEHLVRTDDGVVKPRSMTTDDAADPRAVPVVHKHENQNEEANENDDEDEETPDKPDNEDHNMEGETLPEPDTAATSSSQKHKRTCS